MCLRLVLLHRGDGTGGQTLGDDLMRDLVRAAFRDCLQRWPSFQVDAMVMPRDHLHAIWTLPPGDADYSKRWGAIKKHFTES
jgi:putative transposase